MPLLLAALLALDSSVLASQETATSAWRVSGRVVDSLGAPLAAATLALADAKGREARTQSGDDGRFSVAARGRGRHVLTVVALGFRTVSRAVDVAGASTSLPDIVLRPRPTQAPVVVIGRGDAGEARHLAAADMLSVVSVMTGDQVARENVDFAQELLRKHSPALAAGFAVQDVEAAAAELAALRQSLGG